ncbi:LysE family translocator [Thauera linaloolentis]|uniref:Lysine exporter protein LysE/YggA n=1 Tax=Thauera linaloolentis (strain DSM 12138 / JCM 21573 / CCUG 41526 / CIP 105981 / IAM 15112 / NBRC 102519 / 47Lol) TaxID=1123367 RepID=N6YAF7_THAL4|nr:LysE family translocator [Thauera linaloolentis]ENO88495.1 lysine exporter protein LysE/YggA [Thauera linaloolentis 47Lol = DSM 12138]MCM8567458.1 LysE family translocator [Thauera linaloolentis]
MIDLPLMTYVATMSVTPGPNNIMLAASGVNFGFRRTLPHMFGVSVGSSVQALIVASGLAWVMAWLDTLRLPLVAAGCSYLLWLASRQARAGQPGQGGRVAPLGFLGAALFQWVNPKAWMMVLNAAILFLPRDAGWQAAVVLALVCMAVNLPCIALWAVAGARLREWLQQPLALRAFNYTMAVLLAATAVWIAADETGLLR